MDLLTETPRSTEKKIINEMATLNPIFLLSNRKKVLFRTH